MGANVSGFSIVEGDVVIRDASDLRLLRVFLESSGSSAMNVDGSSGAFEFQVASDPGLTKWITGLRLILEGEKLDITKSEFRRFGDAAGTGGLPNGVIVRAEQSGEIVPICATPIQRIGEFLSYTDDFLNLINAVSSKSSFLSFDFVFDKPIVLAEGGTDRLVVVIQDDLTDIDRFEAIARGYQEFV
jgi:hypothetical protein